MSDHQQNDFVEGAPEADPLEILRRGWGELETPAPDRALEEPDAATEAVLDWMRTAWAELPVPEQRQETRIRSARGTNEETWAPLLRAAAALLVLAAAFALVRLTREGPNVQEPGQHVSQSPELEPDTNATPLDGIRVAGLTNEQIEMRSGPVRLILITPGSAGPQ